MSTTKFSIVVKVVSSLLLAALVLLFAMPRSAKFSYTYAKGSVWTYAPLYADFDFPVLKTSQQIQADREKVSDKILPYFNYSDEIAEQNLRVLLYGTSIKDHEFKQDVWRLLKETYDRGILDDNLSFAGYRKTNPDAIYIHRARRASMVPYSEVFTRSSAKAYLRDSLVACHPDMAVDSLLEACSVYQLVEPNLVFDSETTSLVFEDASANVSTTSGLVRSGTLVVDTGDVITEETCQLLDSYKAEYEANLGYSGPVYFQWLGNALVALVMVSILFFAIYFTNPKVFYDSRFSYLLLVFLITSMLAILVQGHYPRYIFAVPFTLAALYLQAFFRERLIFAVYMVCLLPLLIFSRNGAVIFVIYLFAGAVSLYSFRFFNRKWKQFITALINFAALSLSYLGFWLADLVEGNLLLVNAQFAFSSFFAVAGYPLIYLFERIFNLVSNSRLRDLADTANPLLRELELKAPGTFHHSLQVMNMSEAAARAIGANPLLVKAGAMYHDIGKMTNPQCFVENESLVSKAEDQKYHYGLSYKQSSKDIIRHVPDGVELARKHGLPQVILEFIITHHGTTVTRYFYDKYVSEGGNPADREDFTYPGVPPTTKEQVILMLCDTIEAASRTLKPSSPEDYSLLVDELVQAKMDEGQFTDSEISIKDMETVKEVIKSYLVHLYHERIAYPKDKNNIKK